MHVGENIFENRWFGIDC